MAKVEEIIEKARSLSPAERRKLIEALYRDLEQVKEQDRDRPTHREYVDSETRALRLEWLKSNCEEYGGQYVALDRDQLIAVGASLPYHERKDAGSRQAERIRHLLAKA